ncbi:unnamed protein product [Arctogadus glacialis]
MTAGQWFFYTRSSELVQPSTNTPLSAGLEPRVRRGTGIDAWSMAVTPGASGLPPVITQAPPRSGEEGRGAVHYSVREAAGGWTEGVTSVRVSSSTGDLVAVPVPASPVPEPSPSALVRVVIVWLACDSPCVRS